MDAGKTGAYLAALRKARGMTQQEAADQLGVSNKTVSKWENGAGLPDITVLPALAELYGVTADDILAGETLRGRPAEAQGPARRRLLLLRLRTRFDLCFIGSLALGVLAAFRVAYVSLAAWPLSVGLLWIGYVLAVHPARYGDISLDAKIWENLYRKLLAASAVQWWALLRLVRLGRLEVNFAEMQYYDTMQAWKPLLFAVGLALLCAVLERALRRRAGADASLLWIPERLRPMLHRSGGFLRRTRRLWLVWLAWAVLLAGLWFLADGQLDRVLAPWIARYGEELVQSGFPESWTILRGRLRPMLHRSGGFLRRTRRLWLVWLAWAVLLAGLWFLADGQLDRVLAPWIARYGEELVQSGFPESWTILRGRLEADVALWLRLRQGVLIAGAVSGAGVLVWTLLHWKKRRPPLAEEGET